MTDREILLNAIKGIKTDRAPWVPFVGVHGGSLINATASDYLQSADKIVAGLRAAYDRYQPDGLPVAFDLQIEAEILGCELAWAERTPPSVASHPLSVLEGPGKKLEELPEFSVDSGRMPVVLEATRSARAEFGDKIGLYGLITGPFTLAMHLMGSDLFMAMFDREDEVDALLAYCAKVGAECAEAYIAAGADIVAVVDPMTSQISPEHFERFVTGPVNTVFDATRRAGGLSSLFVCGDATKNLPVMFQTESDNVSIDENIPLESAVALAREHGKSIGGNLKLTVALLMGDESVCIQDAIRCLDAGGETGFVLAPGCDLPYDTPAANLEAVAKVARDPYQRQVGRELTSEQVADAFEDIIVPVYEDEPGVIIDVITLDSAACAPCQYMIAAAERAAEQVAGASVVEHKINARDGLGYMTKLGVQAIPTICIDGRVAFSSIIPDVETLRSEIELAAESKAVPS